MSFFKSIGRVLSRVWRAPEVKEVRHDLELAAKAAVQREINEILLRSLGGPVSAGLVRALTDIDRLAELKAQLDRQGAK